MENEIFKELEKFKKEPISEGLLSDVKSNLKYSFASDLDTTDHIAGELAFYINLATDPGTVNKLFDLYEKVTPEDIQKMTKKYLKVNVKKWT